MDGLIDPVTVVAQIKSDLFFKGPHALTRNSAAALKHDTGSYFDASLLHGGAPAATGGGGSTKTQRCSCY